VRDEVQHARLVLRHLLQARLVRGDGRQCLRLTRQRGGEVCDEVLGVGRLERVPPAEPFDRALHPADDDVRPGLEVAAVDEPGPRQFGGLPVRRHVGVGEGDKVGGARRRRSQPAPTQEFDQGVPRGGDLLCWVDPVPAVAAALVPDAVDAGDVPALHLDHRHPDPRPGDDHVDLALDVVVHQAAPGEQQRLVRQPVPQRLPDGTLGAAVVRERRRGRVEAGHATGLPEPAHMRAGKGAVGAPVRRTPSERPVGAPRRPGAGRSRITQTTSGKSDVQGETNHDSRPVGVRTGGVLSVPLRH